MQGPSNHSQPDPADHGPLWTTITRPWPELPDPDHPDEPTFTIEDVRPLERTTFRYLGVPRCAAEDCAHADCIEDVWVAWCRSASGADCRGSEPPACSPWSVVLVTLSLVACLLFLLFFLTCS